MKIAHIEQIPIAMPLAKRYDNHAGRMRMYDMDQHMVVKVHGDNGLVGYGDYEDNPRPVPQAEIDALIGTNPFDYLLNNFHLALGMALYDLMGKHVGVPAYKLMGQKVRDAVPCAAWTRPCPPDIFAGEIQARCRSGLPRLQNALRRPLRRHRADPRRGKGPHHPASSCTGISITTAHWAQSCPLSPS